MNDLAKKFLHRWHGCAKYNRIFPSWDKDSQEGAKYPICRICKKSGWWIWGYKHFLPDKLAQRVQGSLPDETDKFWMENDYPK